MQNFFSPKISTLYSSGHRNSQYRFHLTSNGALGIVQKKKKKKHAHARRSLVSLARGSLAESSVLRFGSTNR